MIDVFLLTLFGWFVCLVISRTGSTLNTDKEDKRSDTVVYLLAFLALLVTLAFWMIVGLGTYTMIEVLSSVN